MAAYAAVVSLQKTINGLLLNSTSPSSSREILELAYKEASSLQQVLEGLNGSGRSRSSMERVDVLEGEIRECAHRLEDVLEFHELKLLEEKEEEGSEGVMRQEIRSFGEAAKRMGKEYLAELSRDEGDDDDEDTTTNGSSDIDFGVEMIGRSHLFNTVLGVNVLRRVRPERHVIVLLGEEGSGSKLVAKTVFENGGKAGKFERWGWVKVGREYEVKDVLMSLIAQVEPDHHVDDDATEDGLSEYLYKALENRSYMIVLDGVDDVELLDYLLMMFPDEDNGSAVLVTTISPEVLPSCDVLFNCEIPDINEELWHNIRQGLFGTKSIPGELEVAGKQIIRNCGLLSLPLAKTVVFLSKSDKTVEQWSNLAADKDNHIFSVVDEISEVPFFYKT